MVDIEEPQSIESLEADALENLAPMAARGYRGVFLVGKVKRVRRVTSERTQEVSVKVDVVSSEGETMVLKFSTSATIPGINHCGSFLIANVGEYQRQVSADCIAFK
jgi:hypothetical protein